MEHRDFVKLRSPLTVRYKFVNPGGEKLSPALFEGSTANLSAAGMLLTGKIPEAGWLADLLTGRAWIVLNLAIPGDPEPVKAMARVAWIEKVDAELSSCPLGLVFQEIDPDGRAKVQRYVIRAQVV